jgi:hypothetical protein
MTITSPSGRSPSLLPWPKLGFGRYAPPRRPECSFGRLATTATQSKSRLDAAWANPSNEGVGLWRTGTWPLCLRRWRAKTSIMVDASAVELPGEVAASVALLAAFAEPVRWTVLAGSTQSPLCVCDLQEPVPIAANLSATTCDARSTRRR